MALVIYSNAISGTANISLIQPPALAQQVNHALAANAPGTRFSVVPEEERLTQDIANFCRGGPGAHPLFQPRFQHKGSADPRVESLGKIRRLQDGSMTLTTAEGKFAIQDDKALVVEKTDGAYRFMQLLDGSLRLTAADGEEYHLFQCAESLLEGHFYSKAPGDRYVRAHPRISPADTMMGFSPAHDGRQDSSFTAAEIKARHQDVRHGWVDEEAHIEDRVSAYNGLHILLQCGQRACSATAATMLLLDHGRQIDVFGLLTCNLGNSKSMTYLIEGAGLKALHTERIPNVEKLTSLISRHGPGVATLYMKNIGVHSIVIDEADLDVSEAVIRDPFHGWQIRITLQALIDSYLHLSDFIQVTD